MVLQVLQVLRSARKGHKGAQICQFDTGMGSAMLVPCASESTEAAPAAAAVPAVPALPAEHAFSADAFCAEDAVPAFSAACIEDVGVGGVRRPCPMRVQATLKRQNVVLYRQATASIARARALSAHNASLEQTIRRLTQELDCARILQGEASDILDEELDALRHKCHRLEILNHDMYAAGGDDSEISEISEASEASEIGVVRA